MKSIVTVPNTPTKIASFRFTATNIAVQLTKLIATTTINGATAITNLIWKDGATIVATIPFIGATSSQDNLNISIPSNTNKILDVYAELGAVGTPGSATTSANIQVALNGFNYLTSNQATTSTTTLGTVGNPIYAMRSKPTISVVALPSTTLSDATSTKIAKFTIAADSNGAVSWRNLSLQVATSGVALSQISIYEDSNIGTFLASTTVSSSSVAFLSPTDQVVDAGTSKTYVVMGTTVGSSPGDSITTQFISTASNVVQPNAYANIAVGTTNFVWSDQSSSPHTATSADWMNDYLIRNLPLAAQTLSL